MAKTIYLTLIYILISALSVAPTRSNAFESGSADTTYIAVNKHGGWQFVSPYLSPMGKDSVRLEMILQHERSIDWKQKQLVGRITRRNLLPVTEQVLNLDLIINQFRICIVPNGNCYLQQISGKLPDDNLLVIPVRAIYKLRE